MTPTYFVAIVGVFTWIAIKIKQFQNKLSYRESHPPIPVYIIRNNDSLAKTFENEIERCNKAGEKCMKGTEASYHVMSRDVDVPQALNRKFHAKRSCDPDTELGYARFLV